MDMPALLPKELDYCERLRGEEQIVPALLSRSDEHFVRFVEAALDDETWMGEHQPLMQSILALATQEFSSKRLRLEHAARIVTSIHAHVEAVKTLLPQDLRINIGKRTWLNNTLLFGSPSAYFRRLIEANYRPNKILDLTVDSHPEVFLIVEEFLQTGTVRDLWKRPEVLLMAVLVQAGQWQIKDLQRLCADVLKRYVTPDTAVSMLNIAQSYVLPELKNACCEVLNLLPLGVKFRGQGEAELVVIIEEIRDRGYQLLIDAAPAITHLGLRGQVGENKILQELLSKCRNLMSVDLTGSKECDVEIFQFTPKLRELTLTGCPWLDDSKVTYILEHNRDLNKLVISENPQIRYEGYRKMSTLGMLESFIATSCDSLEDGHIEMIARGCDNLIEVDISWCPKITDLGLRALGARRPELKVVNISHCMKVSDAGLHDLMRPCFQLESLTMQQCLRVTEEGIVTLPKLSTTIKYLDISLCDITEAGVELIRQRYPRLKLIF